MKIQLIENSARMRGTIIKIIDRNDYEYFHCDEGEDAISQYILNKPDWVLIDLEMKKISGLIIACQIRHTDPTAKIILLSGYDEYEFRKTAEKNGVRHYLLKENLLSLQELIT